MVMVDDISDADALATLQRIAAQIERLDRSLVSVAECEAGEATTPRDRGDLQAPASRTASDSPASPAQESDRTTRAA